MINRNFYLDHIIRTMWNGEIKVITGIKCCGKTVLLFRQFYQYLIDNGVKKEQIIKISLDEKEHYKYRNPAVLCEYIESVAASDKEKKYYLFIDEVQLTAKVIDRKNGNIEVTVCDMLNELRAYKNLDVYVTGSNSRGLSSDIATQFRGRSTQIHVYPLSFHEFYSAVGGDKNTALDQYMLYGGLPAVAALKDERDKKEYLTNLYSELYVRDIAERNSIEREDLLNDILDFLASHISSLTNPNNIATCLSSMKNEKVNSALVSIYLQHIMDSFLIYKARRFDVKRKRYFRYPNKYYYSDPGLCNSRLNYRQYDPGHMMENLIYNELVRRGHRVDTGAVTDRSGRRNVQKEVNFVVNDNDKRAYIQSAFFMDTDDEAKSVLKPLLLTKDCFRKVVIRQDIPHNYYDDNGIFHCSLIDFLLEEVNIF